MSKSIEMEKRISNSGFNEDTPEYLIREEQPDGTIKVRPRFSPWLNSIFSNMSKKEKISLLTKPEAQQIDELKELYREDFLKKPIEVQKGILKKLSYSNSMYDIDKIAGVLPSLESLQLKFFSRHLQEAAQLLSGRK